MREIVETIRPEQLCVGSDIFTAEMNDPVMWFRWRSFRAVEMPAHTRRIVEYETPARIVGIQ